MMLEIEGMNRGAVGIFRDPPQSLLPFTSASGFVRDWLGVFHVVSVGAETIVEAMDAVEEHRLSFRNATLWATARQSGCSAILT